MGVAQPLPAVLEVATGEAVMRRGIALPVAIAVMVALFGAAVLMLAACAPPDDPAQLHGGSPTGNMPAFSKRYVMDWHEPSPGRVMARRHPAPCPLAHG